MYKSPSHIGGIAEDFGASAGSWGRYHPDWNINSQPWADLAFADTALVISANASDPYWNAIVHAAKARLLDAVKWEQGCDQMASLAGFDVAIVDCRDAPERAGERARQAAQWADMRGAALIVLTDLAGLDAAFAAITGSRTMLLCDPSDGELIVALRVALDYRSPPPMLREGANEAGHVQYQHLLEEFGRLSHMLESLLSETSAGFDSQALHAPMMGDDPRPTHLVKTSKESLTANQVRALLRARRLRDQVLPGDLFADPAWDMLLDLMAAHLEGRRVSVSSLCIASAVPPHDGLALDPATHRTRAAGPSG